MRVRTNLTSDELELVSKGLSKLAKMQRPDNKFVPVSRAESQLMKKVDASLDIMLDNLTDEIDSLFQER